MKTLWRADLHHAEGEQLAMTSLRSDLVCCVLNVADVRVREHLLSAAQQGFRVYMAQFRNVNLNVRSIDLILEIYFVKR